MRERQPSRDDSSKAFLGPGPLPSRGREGAAPNLPHTRGLVGDARATAQPTGHTGSAAPRGQPHVNVGTLAPCREPVGGGVPRGRRAGEALHPRPSPLRVLWSCGSGCEATFFPENVLRPHTEYRVKPPLPSLPEASNSPAPLRKQHLRGPVGLGEGQPAGPSCTCLFPAPSLGPEIHSRCNKVICQNC